MNKTAECYNSFMQVPKPNGTVGIDPVRLTQVGQCIEVQLSMIYSLGSPVQNALY